jgi:two-component system chemotaxis sensor kinase CheA
LFRSGVSTREEITDISGRGVGLDVVAREVASVGGEVHAETTHGLGFRLVLTMPTVLRADVVVPLAYRGHRLALPCRNVEGFVRLEQLEETTAGAHARVRRDGAVESLPVYTLAPIFKINDAPSVGRRGVLVNHDGTRFVLVVDEHGNPRPMPFQPIGELAVRSRVVRAVAPSPEGVRLLLDVHALIAALKGIVVAASKPGERHVASVVVVEDAPVARELLCGILRSFGLSVHEAAHGREGLSRIRAVGPDLVLSDVEMPFMSGPDMIAELRNEPRFSELPVIVLTTDTSEATRKRVSSLGVLGFLSKQRFVESELRELVDLCLQHRR